MNSTAQVVLAIDDEPGILKVIEMELTEHGFRVLTANTGAEGLAMAEAHHPDLVLLDITMPVMSGLEALEALRARSAVPVILLSALKTDGDKVRGLELGADDYVSKPFSLDELNARVRAILRRQPPEPIVGEVIQIGRLSIDLGSRIVRRDNEIVNFTRTEWSLLQCLATNADKFMTNREILGKVWGPEYVGDLQYLRVWISRVRIKLDPDGSLPSVIRTYPGNGYMLVSQPEALAEQVAAGTE